MELVGLSVVAVEVLPGSILASDHLLLCCRVLLQGFVFGPFCVLSRFWFSTLSLGFGECLDDGVARVIGCDLGGEEDASQLLKSRHLLVHSLSVVSLRFVLCLFVFCLTFVHSLPDFISIKQSLHAITHRAVIAELP